MRVRTTIRPDQEVEVDDTEYLDLKRMGLIVEDAPGVEAAPPAVPQPRTSTPDKTGKEE